MGTLTPVVLYEDNHIIAAVKPFGVLSQADHTGAPDMLALLKAYIKEKYQKPGDVFLGLVHRLDRPTGGVMVFARTSKGASRISASIRNGSFKKIYHCVLKGKLSPASGALTHYLIKDEARVMSFAVGSDVPGAKQARLEYNVLAEKDGLSLVSVRLLTGRHHQIRVQFASEGCPVYGDRKYGGYSGNDELALWSYSISFPHPTKKETVTITAPPESIYPFSLF